MSPAVHDHRARSRVPTLLVFTLGAESEARRHPLLPESLRDSEIQLRRACLASVLGAGRTVGCRLEVSSPRPLSVDGASWWEQRGASFGERFHNALVGAWSRTPGPVIAVGTDAPGLGPRHLRRALELLAQDENRVVLGPAGDGGVYLVAAARPIEDLQSVSWCGRGTRQSLRRALRRAKRPVALLAPLEDLDRPCDLDRWIATSPRGPLLAWARRLGRLLAARRLCGLNPPRPYVPTLWAAASLGRAPPSPLPPPFS
jgi:hypothetical protein